MSTKSAQSAMHLFLFPLVNCSNLWYNKDMNGYDFDDTILKGNSMFRFSLFCAARLPYLVLFIPVLFVASLLRGVRILNKNRYLHMLSWFVALVPHTEKFASKFWDKNMKHIKQWYLDQRRDDDVVISASPQFLAGEACRRLGIRCVGSPLSPRSARLHGEHCYAENKVDTYKEVFGDTTLATYYSDSLSDTPMFELAEKGYFVHGDNVMLLYENGQKVVPFKNKRQLRKYMRNENQMKTVE